MITAACHCGRRLDADGACDCWGYDDLQKWCPRCLNWYPAEDESCGHCQRAAEWEDL